MKPKKLIMSDVVEPVLSQDEEIKFLKEQNQLLMEKLEKLLDIATPKNVQSQPVVIEDKQEIIKDDFNREEIKNDDYIKVISLCDSSMSVSTLGYGKGKQFRFKEFGDTKRIVYNELVSILEYYPHFIKDGRLYIADPRVIRRHGLDDIYTTIIGKEKIQKVLDCNDEQSVLLFEKANEQQRAIIVEMLVTKIANGKDLDLNIVDKISRIAKVDITKKANEMKELSAIK